jgi:hypothetical protein
MEHDCIAQAQSDGLKWLFQNVWFAYVDGSSHIHEATHSETSVEI